MKKALALGLILERISLLVASSSCQRSVATVSAEKSTNSILMVKKSNPGNSLLLPLGTLLLPTRFKPEEIYDIVPIPVEKPNEN